jgi:hypothetical protein
MPPVVCPTSPTVDNATFSCAPNSTVGSTCNGTCQSNFTSLSPPVATCSEDGEWSVNNTCEPGKLGATHLLPATWQVAWQREHVATEQQLQGLCRNAPEACQCAASLAGLSRGIGSLSSELPWLFHYQLVSAALLHNHSDGPLFLLRYCACCHPNETTVSTHQLHQVDCDLLPLMLLLLQCHPSLQWSAQPPLLPTATFDCAPNSTVGSTCDGTCLSGFDSLSPPVAICGEDGEWSVNNTCEPGKLGH